MFRAIGWFLWGCICWVDAHLFAPLRRRRARRRATRQGTTPPPTARRILGARMDALAEKSKQWALRQETPEAREWLTIAGALGDQERVFSSRELFSVYEQLRLYLLTGKWKPSLKRLRYGAPILVFLGINVLAVVELSFWELGLPTLTPIFLLLATLLLFIGYALAFRPALQQLTSGQKSLLRWLVAGSWLVWLLAFLQLATERDLAGSVGVLLVLGVLCLACLIFIVPLCAYALQWRLLDVGTAIGNWLSVNVSSDWRQRLVATVTAWILMLAPDRNGELGWHSSRDIDHLLETSTYGRK